MPHAPLVAIEMRDRSPTDWSPLLLKAWGDVMNDPAAWAKAAEAAGAELLQLDLSLTGPDGSPPPPPRPSPRQSRAGRHRAAAGCLWPGPGREDNELLVAVAEAAKGERLLLGICEDKNYRTIVATALANGHLVNARTPMDVNLAKQLNILISDMGLALDRILMDPTTGALGYGIEYGYSVMERLRLAALQGDCMTQLPMLVTPGDEAWKTKEAKVGEGVPEAWGDWEERAINWEVADRHGAARIGRRCRRAAPPRERPARQAAIDELMPPLPWPSPCIPVRRTCPWCVHLVHYQPTPPRSSRYRKGEIIWLFLDFKSTSCCPRPTAKSAASPPAWPSP